MKQAQLPGIEPGGRLRPELDAGGGLIWVKERGLPAPVWGLYRFGGYGPDRWTGYAVHHCGGNRPLWPYYITKEGRPGMILAPNGRGFAHVATARAYALQLYHEEGTT